MGKNKGIMRLIRAFGYSFDGLKNAIKNEAAFRQELIVGVPFCVVALFLDVSNLERTLLVGAIFLVWITELLNSAIEECVNLNTSEIHPLAKRAKDMASAAVLLSILLCGFVWVALLV